ncbi:MAG: TIGR01458 family HAD-type hydrolase [Gammaproteobacteria bacterium]|nr:TIGR01458 family HAD-type hydrolase [Gammaproteobacteria bacterium]
MKGILFDLDGVMYQSNEAIPGALQALHWVQERDIPYCFVTNTTSKPRSAIVDKLAGMGITTTADRIVSPPRAAAHWLRTHNRGPVALFVPEATQVEFADLQQWDETIHQPASAVVVGDLGTEWSFARLNQAFTCLMQEPRPVLIALGMTRYWKAPGGLQLDTGPFVAALEYATGLAARVFGKPAPTFFQVAADTLGLEPGELLMIGDDIRGDVEGAQEAGLKAVLVKTGKFRPEDLQGKVRPDAVLESVAELPAWWGKEVQGQA